ncbi:MAG: hypothetical protein ACFFCU_17965 [Promethearchaeota archaeon]
MVSILDLFPIITILAIGAGIWRILHKFEPKTFRKTEYFNIFLLIGIFSLILPLTWIGIQPNGVWRLSVGSYSINLIDFNSWCLLYFLLGLMITIIIGYTQLQKALVGLENFNFDLKSFKDYRIVLIAILLLDYLILETILPLRGFDALYYYFPEAEVFYQTGRITEVNYLSFLPVVKSPLNVLLYVYTYYITGELAINLIPFLFLLGLVFLIYDFSLEIFNDRSLALTAAIFVLVLPFTYWLMNYWAFYQDLYLCYFFSVTCYFSLKWYKSPSILSLGIFMGMGLVTSLFTKITGWTLPIILVLLLPTGQKGKKGKLAIITVLGIFLCAQAATKIFIGAIFPIIASLSIVSFLIIKEKPSDNPKKALIQLIAIGMGMICGSLWLLDRISISRSVWDEIYHLYFRLSESIIWTYPQQSSDPMLHTLETVHHINFISAVSILLLGTIFTLFWVILKIYAFKNYHPAISPLIWILTFFGIWSAYYLVGSIRYLAPIITPMILLVSWGLYQLIRNIKTKTNRDFVEIMFIFLGVFNFYYLIPLDSLSISEQTQEIIGFRYNQAALNYYQHPEILVLQAIGFSLLVLFFIIKNPAQQLRSYQKKITSTWINALLLDLAYVLSWFKKKINITWISTILLCLIIMIPLAVQSYLLLYTQGDINEFHAIHEYEYRAEYQELVRIIQQQNQPLVGIMTYQTPGFQFFTHQPVIDIYYQRNFFLGDPFFTSTNLTELIGILRTPFNYTFVTDFKTDLNVPIKFIIVPAAQNLYYNLYNTSTKTNSLFFESLEVNNTFFGKLFSNSDFDLYEVFFY